MVCLNGLSKDLGMYIIVFLESGRIDFGYVGYCEFLVLLEEEFDVFNVY